MAAALNCITINTDASFHPEHKVGGYAFSIVCDLFRIRKGGMFKKDPETSEEAELMCIGNALMTLVAQKELPEIKWIIINTDCKWGITRIKENRTAICKTINRIQNELKSKARADKLVYRHVKAHSDKDDLRSKSNEWCDSEAKRWMRKAVSIKLSKV